MSDRLIANEIEDPRRFVISKFYDTDEDRFDTDLETMDDPNATVARLGELASQGRLVRAYDFQSEEYIYP